ncbi:MAG: aminotransferase class I/II-fold pyridoxal phosphate-dependent enzyme [Ilumatobacteraceae bacterium]
MNRYPKRDDLRAMSGYHSPQVSVPVRLNTNESPIEPPTEFVRDLAAAVGDIRWNRYPDRAARELRSAIAALHQVRPENVFVANGSNEVLQSVLLAYGGAGRTVATFEPTYQLHSHIARIAGSTVVNGNRNGDFTLSEDEVRRVLTDHQPSVTFLCSPNNPTGLAEDPALIASTVATAPGVVVVDEAYAQFSPHSALPLVNDESRVAVSRTFSKTWSMAAARLGYLIGPTWMIEDLDVVALPYHLDALKQVAGITALRYVSHMERGVADVVAERERLLSEMRTMPLTVWPSQANFILFRPDSTGGEQSSGARSDGARSGGGPAGGAAGEIGRRVWQHLLDNGVLVRDCSSWEGLAGCLRVTVGSAGENDAFLVALRSAVSARD